VKSWVLVLEVIMMARADLKKLVVSAEVKESGISAERACQGR